MKNIIYPVIASLLFLTSCNGTWIMYDTDQNDHIYFQDRQQVLIKSFALLADDEIDVEAPVYIMGTVSDQDRPFKLESVPSEEGDTIAFGGITYPVISAREGVISRWGTVCFLPERLPQKSP